MDTEFLKILLNAGALGAIVAWFALRHTPRQEDRQDKRDSAFLAALHQQHVEHAAEIDRQQSRWDTRFDRIEDALDGKRIMNGRA